jgi:hypothetical protein
VKKGRQSAASLDIATAIIDVVERPSCPHDLSDEEAEIWFGIINRMPADWFPTETHPLLIQYCRHAVQARKVAELIERASGDPNLKITDYERLLRMQGQESRMLATLATKLRVSQQTRYDKSRKKGNAQPRKPWQG